MSSTTEEIDWSTGSTWLTIPIRPIVPATALMPSRTGTPAATSAPNASSRMISVIGSDSCERGRNAGLRLVEVAGQVEADEHRAAVARDAPGVAVRVGALDVRYAGDLRHARLDVGHGGLEA